MKILLIRPPQVRWSNEASRCGTPTGLLSIASILRQYWEVDFIDAVAEGYRTQVEIEPGVFVFGLQSTDLALRIAESRPDVIGITNSFTSYWRTTLSTAELARRVCPEAKIVVGGHHVSGVPSECLALDLREAIDYVVIGEGETTIVELVRRLESAKAPPEDLPAVAYRADGEIRVNPGRPRLLDACELPKPALDLLDSRLYNKEMSHFGAPKGENFLDVVFSRGCPVGCTFCTSTDFWGSKPRVPSRARLVDELESAVELGWQEVVLEDDNILTLPSSSQLDILSALERLEIPWNLDGGLYYPAIRRDFVRALAKAGCYRAFVPIEHPRVELMHAYRKYASVRAARMRDERLRRVADWFHAEGIEFYSAIMIGFPGESMQSIEAALEYGAFVVESLGAIGCAFHWVHPYPYTAMYSETYPLVDPGRRWEDRSEYYTFAKPVFPIQGISLDDASRIVDEAFYSVNGTRSRTTSFESWRTSAHGCQEF